MCEVDTQKDSPIWQSVTSKYYSSKVSKNDANLELLKEFPYETEDVVNKKDGTTVTIYKCMHSNCDKEFTRTWNMLDHARTHKGVKPYQCQWCPRKFTQKGNLKKHMKQHLEPTLAERKKYKCKYCPSRYTEKYNYNIHMKRNHPEKFKKEK